MVVGRSGLHYGAAAVRVIFLAIFYVETPVQILLRALFAFFSGIYWVYERVRYKDMLELDYQ